MQKSNNERELLEKSEGNKRLPLDIQEYKDKHITHILTKLCKPEDSGMASDKSVLLNGSGEVADNSRSSIYIAVKENVTFSAFYKYYDRYAHSYIGGKCISWKNKIKFQTLNSKGVTTCLTFSKEECSDSSFSSYHSIWHPKKIQKK